MTLIPYYSVAREKALRETRSITVTGDPSLPDDDYGFLEWYCDEAGCDCRRVIFRVLRKSAGEKVWATITFGWESPAYYKAWSRYADDEIARDMASASLEPTGPQSEYSYAILQLFKSVLQTNEAYVARLKEHYYDMGVSRTSKSSHRPSAQLRPGDRVKRRKR